MTRIFADFFILIRVNPHHPRSCRREQSASKKSGKNMKHIEAYPPQPVGWKTKQLGAVNRLRLRPLNNCNACLTIRGERGVRNGRFRHQMR